MPPFPRLLALALITINLAACSPREPAVEDAWIRLPAAAGRPGAAYFTIEGGQVAEVLVGVSTPAATRAELHETMTMGGGGMSMSRMAPLSRVALPPSETVTFAPGGRHVMLYGITPATRAGAQVPITVTLEDGKTLAATARVVGPGYLAP